MQIILTTYWVRQFRRNQVLIENDPVQGLVGLEDTPLE